MAETETDTCRAHGRSRAILATMQVHHHELVVETHGFGQVVDCDNRPRNRLVVVSFVGTGKED